MVAMMAGHWAVTKAVMKVVKRVGNWAAQRAEKMAALSAAGKADKLEFQRVEN